MRLIGLRVQNFRSLADVTLGQVEPGVGEPLGPFVCFVGPNDSGKSNVLDALAFLGDCLRGGVESALEGKARGGFRGLLTRGATPPIRLTLVFSDDVESRLLTYTLSLKQGRRRPTIAERLDEIRTDAGGSGSRRLFNRVGEKISYLPDHDAYRVPPTTLLARASKSETHLALWLLGLFAYSQTAGEILGILMFVSVSNAHAEAQRVQPPVEMSATIDGSGGLSKFLYFLSREKPADLRKLVDRVAVWVPELNDIRAETSKDDRLLIAFHQKGHTRPFYQNSVSDGVLSAVAIESYLIQETESEVLLFDEPEQGLYPEVQRELAERLRCHAAEHIAVWTTTHAPQFLNALDLTEIFVTQKIGGRTEVRRASDSAQLRRLVQEGDVPGDLWTQGLLVQEAFAADAVGAA